MHADAAGRPRAAARRCARAAHAVGHALREVELLGQRRSTPARPASSWPASQLRLRTARTRRARRPRSRGAARRSATASDVRADAEDLLDQQRCRARGRTAGIQTCRSKALVADGARRRCAIAVMAIGAWPWTPDRTLSAVRWRTSTTSCPPAAIAQTPVEPRDAARLLVDRGRRRARAPPRPRPARPAARRRPRRRQRHAGDPGPAARCSARDRRRGRGAAARAARCRRRAGRRWCARRASCATARSLLAADGDARRARSAPAPRPATRARCALLVDDDPLAAARPHRRDAAAAVHHRRRSPTPSATRPCTPAGPARRRRRPPACTSRRACSPRWPTRGVAVARVELVVGLDTFQPVSVDDPADHRDAQRALPGAAPRRSAAVPGRRAGGGGRHHDRAGARVARPRPASSAGRTDLFIRRPVRLAAGRRAAHQLPPAAHDAADDDRRVRRAALARPVRDGAGRRATGSCPSATRCSCERSRRDARAVALRRRRPPTARPGPAWPTPPAARTARRASCRSAPGARSST